MRRENYKKNLQKYLSYLSIGIVALLFMTPTTNAQEKDIEEHYLEYFKLPREALFLHTNKTTYLTNEDIWFKAYAYDRKNALSSKSTTNIYFGLYDSEGKQISKKLYLSKSGAAEGNFEIDSTFTSGEYYLKVSTNWMNNFKEDDSFIQKIQIINPKKQVTPKKKTNVKEYDFQFLPEGGYAIVDVKNTIGIKAIDDSGKGISATGIIYNSSNEEITRFKSNSLGIGKFSFTPEKGESYTSKITLDNGKEFEQELKGFKEVGVAMTVNNLLKGKTIITFSMNQESFELYGEDRFKLLVHQEGKVKSIPVGFDGLTKQIVISKDNLFSGMNTVTLFNEDEEPILERIFFNAQNATKDFGLYLSKTKVEDDSLSFRLRSKNDLVNVLNASISVLPAETKSYNPDHSIVSAFHLKPYVRGNIENPHYYFKDFNRRKQSELDALLITQGWSRYSWDRIFNLPPKPSYDFENGISINGFVNKNLSDIKQLLLYKTDFNKSKFIDIDNEGKFNLTNFYPVANEEIRFSYMDKKGKMKKPSMSLSYVNFVSNDEVDTKNYQSFISFYTDKETISENFILDDSYEELDEIRLKTDYKRKLREETRDPILVNGRVTKINEAEIDRYPFVTDFIQNNGFDVMVMPINSPDGRYKMGDVVIRSRGRGAISTTSSAVANVPISPTYSPVPNETEQMTERNEARTTAEDISIYPTVFLDGMILSDANVLLNMGMEMVDRVVIDKTGIGLGLSGGFGGAIKIYTRRGVFVRETKGVNTTIYTNVSEFGFQPIKEFYTPKYASYNMKSFKDYGIIHWEPNLDIMNGMSSDFNIVNTGTDEINFYIEGISSDGKVFSQVIKVDNSKSK